MKGKILNLLESNGNLKAPELASMLGLDEEAVAQAPALRAMKTVAERKITEETLSISADDEPLVISDSPPLQDIIDRLK